MQRLTTVRRTIGDAVVWVTPYATSSPGTTENEWKVSLAVVPEYCDVDDTTVTVRLCATWFLYIVTVMSSAAGAALVGVAVTYSLSKLHADGIGTATGAQLVLMAGVKLPPFRGLYCSAIVAGFPDFAPSSRP